MTRPSNLPGGPANVSTESPKLIYDTAPLEPDKCQTQEFATLTNVAMDFTLEDWEDLGLDHGDVFWDTALDNYQNLFLLNPPSANPTLHPPDGKEEPEAQKRGSPGVVGLDMVEVKNFPLPQDSLEEGQSQETVETFSKNSLRDVSLGETSMGERCLESLLDSEILMRSDIVTDQESPTGFVQHKFRRGLSSEPLLVTGKEFLVHDLSQKNSPSAKTQYYGGESLLDSEILMRSDIVTDQESPTGFVQHKFRRGLSSEPLLVTGKEFLVHDLSQKNSPSAKTQYYGGDLGCHSEQNQQGAGVQEGQELYKCSECEKSFCRSYLLIQHWIIHAKEKSTVQHEDGTDFNQDSSLLVSPVPHPENSSFVFDKGKETLSQNTYLLWQQKIDTGEKRQKSPKSGCEKCSQPGEHQEHHPGDPSCEYSKHGKDLSCTLHFTEPQKMRPQKSQKHYECTECKATFNLSKHLRHHQKSHAAKATPEDQEYRETCERSLSLVRHRAVCFGEKHQCNECGKCFRHRSTLKIHQQSHSGEKPFKCSECGKAFSRSTYLTEHKRIHTGYRPHKCPRCVKSFSRPSHLFRHQLSIHATEKSYSCAECRETFSHSEFFQHQKIHTLETPYKCQECGERFVCHSTLICHQKTHTGDEWGLEGTKVLAQKLRCRRPSKEGEKCFTCKTCEKTFSDRKQLIQHERSHPRPATVEEPFECRQCGRTFHQNTQLLRHQKIHSGVKLYECEDCGKIYICKSSLLKHRSNLMRKRPALWEEEGAVFEQRADLTEPQLTEAPEKRFQCSKCDRAFTYINCFIQHQRTHIGKKSFECKECGKTYDQKSYLSRHQKVHTGERPCVCKECGKSFSTGAQLIRHQRVHSRVKPYVCQECGKAFRHNSCLSVHQRVHTGEKPFVCAECGKAFAQKTNLTNHTRVHTGEKPYTCDVCSKAFRFSTHLTQHRRIHTQEKPYRCQLCQKTFRSCSGLRRHERVHTKK